LTVSNDGPHQALNFSRPQDRRLAEVFDILWRDYRSKMEYVAEYEDMLREHGARFWNDHVAFRTIAWERPAVGIFSISRPFEALGYRAEGCYEFPDKHLSSIHFRPPHSQLPKLFITQLKSWELSAPARKILARSLNELRPSWATGELAELAAPLGPRGVEWRRLCALWLRRQTQLPWVLPQKKDVLTLEKESPFAAWVLLNGHGVNHFTASVDSHGVRALNDIEKTSALLRVRGVPMKKEIEGSPGSRLRQTSTEAVVLPTRVRVGKKDALIPWTYAYFEILQRPLLKSPLTGRRERFEGFLGAQATNLFGMTDRS
jgi:hypothetical protein